MHALARRYGHAEVSETLSVAQVEQLPTGTLLWFSGHAWIIVPGGLAPTSILPERAGTHVPAGESVASIGGPFTLIARGTGKVITHGAANRKVMAWYEGRR